MQTLTVVMTVFNRPLITLTNTLMYLRQCLPDSPVIVVDDASDKLPQLREMCESFRCEYLRCDTVAEVEGCYHIDGYNNPAHAFNRGLEKVGTQLVAIMSSDLMVQAKCADVLKHYAENAVFESAVWTPTIVDMQSGAPFLAPNVLWPMPWFMVCDRERLRAVGDYDENYCKGIAFEDNDLSARLLCELGSLIVDGNCVAWHQSHPQTAYSDGGRGWSVNEKYTVQKWGGVPFRPNDQSVRAELEEQRDGVFVFKVTKREGMTITEQTKASRFLP